MKEDTISKYWNIHKGKRCFILGSGPSILKQDLSLLKDEITFCSNWFINHEQINRINVNYYCAYDINFVKPQPNQQWIEKLSNYNFAKFFPLDWKKLNIPLKGISYVKYCGETKVYELNKFSTDPINIGFYDGASVIINLSIPLAIYMGMSEIFLLGCDSVYAIKNDDLSKAYFYNIKEHHTATVHNELTEKIWQKNLFQSYEVVLDYCIRKGINIVNCTDGGELEIFPRANYCEIIKDHTNV